MKNFITKKLIKNPNNGFLCELLVNFVYKKAVKPSDIVIDGGANVGVHTHNLINLVGEDGKCYAIEALPFLSENLRNDYGHIRQCQVVNLALSNENGKASFTHVINDNSYSGLIERPKLNNIFENPQTEKIEVETDLLDNIVPDFEKERVKFVKFDLEGGEYRAFQGSIETLKLGRPLIIFEQGYHSVAEMYGYTEHDFFSFFNGLNYNIYTLLGIPVKSWELKNYLWYNIGIPKEKISNNIYIKHFLAIDFISKEHDVFFGSSKQLNNDLWQKLWL